MMVRKIITSQLCCLHLSWCVSAKLR